MKKYDNYKVSGIEWIGEIPSHWKKIKFSYITNLMTCGHASTPEYVEEGGIPFLSAQNIKNEKLDLTVLKQVPISLHESLIKNKKVEKGDLLQVRVGGADTIGQTAIVDLDFDFSIYVSLAHIKLNELALNGYVKHLCNSVEFKEYCGVLMKKGAGVANLNVSDVASMLIPLPSIEEQNSIANYLDQKTTDIDNLIAKKERLIQLLEEERTVIINQAVTKGLDPTVPMKDSSIEWLGEIPENWEVKKIKFVALLKSGENITSESIKEEGDYPVYGGNGLRGYYSEFTNDGDYILIGRQGALCGNIKYARNRFWASEHAIVCYLKPNVNWLWFGKLLESMNLNQYNQSAAQPGLAVGVIKNLSIPFPNIEKQNEIVEFIIDYEKRTDEIIEKTKNEIELLKEYKTALISEVVTGKVDVREEILN